MEGDWRTKKLDIYNKAGSRTSPVSVAWIMHFASIYYKRTWPGFEADASACRINDTDIGSSRSPEFWGDRIWVGCKGCKLQRVKSEGQG